MSHIIQRVYLDRDNVANVRVRTIDDNGDLTDVDLTGLYKVEVVMYGAGSDGSDLTLSSDLNPMTWDSSGNLEMYLGDADIPVGEYAGALIGYDIAHQDGQYIAHPGAQSRITFRVLQ